MKKLVLLAMLASTLALSACMGIRGHDGKGKVCENSTFLGISLIEIFSPCQK
ncbi:MAG: hypothetical protein MJ247_00125 [Alphaproteobacteria bacterium]|nr:hypothetical protein [Alphaproteobacteria bacterium]MCQ2913591.1 hypothetical protein [Alphaproteobacteria bacterium]